MESYPPLVQSALSKMTEEQKLTFESEYGRRKRSMPLLVVLAIFFPIQHFLLGKVGLGIALWLTIGGLGVWWFIEIFLTPKRVNDYNDAAAVNLARDVKIMTDE